MIRSDDPLRRNPDFLKLWSAQALSAIGSRITREGLPMIAALALGASAAELGLLVAAAAVPVVLLGPFAGVFVDRASRRRIMIVADLARAAALAVLPVAFLAGVLTMAHVIAVAALVAFLSMLFQTADGAYLPQLVGREHLLDANAKLAATDAVAEVSGPAIAGVLIQLLTAPVAVAVDAASFLCSAVLLGRIRRPETPMAPIASRPEIRRDLVEGFAFAFRHPALGPLLVALGSFTFFATMLAPLYVLYAVRDLQIPPGLLGIVIAMGGVGALLGARLAAGLGRRFRPGRLLPASLAGVGVMMGCVPLADGPPVAAAAILMLPQLFGDAAHVVFATNALTLRQQVTPDALLGRVGATIHWMTGGLGLLSALGAGFLAEWIGVRPVLWIAALGVMASSLWLLRLPRDADATADGEALTNPAAGPWIGSPEGS